jgi:hypothetical protein
MNTDKKILDYFGILDKKEMLGTSYLFLGDNHQLVQKILKSISCKQESGFCDECWDCKAIESEKHPDLFIARPEPSFIKIESIREAQKFLSLKSFRLKRKLLIIREGQNFGLEAANAFLKTLEEPPKNSFIAICSSKMEGLLPTILSRCKKVFLPPQKEEGRDLDFDVVEDFLNNRRVSFKDRREFSQFLEALIVVFRDKLFFNMGLDDKLLEKGGYSRIRQAYTAERIEDILDNILNIYGAYNTVNENLALNLIRASLQ